MMRRSAGSPFRGRIGAPPSREGAAFAAVSVCRKLLGRGVESMLRQLARLRSVQLFARAVVLLWTFVRVEVCAWSIGSAILSR